MAPSTIATVRPSVLDRQNPKLIIIYSFRHYTFYEDCRNSDRQCVYGIRARWAPRVRAHAPGSHVINTDAPRSRLIGAVLRKHGFVRIFSFLLCATLSVEVGSSIWYLITFYHTRGQTEAECVNGSTDQARIAYCKSLDAYRRVPQGALLASVIVPLVLQACACLIYLHNHLILIYIPDACYIVYQYSKRLQYQRADRQRSSSAFVPPVGPMYQPLKHTDETHMLAQQYPYSDSTHAFGHKPQGSIDKV